MTGSVEWRMHDRNGGATLAEVPVPVPEPGPSEVRLAVRRFALHVAHPMERVADAVDELDTGSQFGKIVSEPARNQSAGGGSER